MSEHNIISVSGGKDSTALLLLALERGAPNLQAVFADTGHEHPQTYAYVEYLDKHVHPIRTVRADFTAQIAAKADYVRKHWKDDLMEGVPGEWEWMPYEAELDGGCEPVTLAGAPIAMPAAPDNIEQVVIEKHSTGIWKWTPGRSPMSSEEADAWVSRALAVLVPTGVPFLDLCIWKGRFPSTRARFCSEELKRNPIMEQVQMPLMDEGHTVISWQGVRADESANRANLPERDAVGGGLWNYRPILRWTAADAFAMHHKHGVKPNPLYLQGMGRVGCMPCLHCRKDELLEIARRFFAELQRLAEWERIVSLASKRGCSTFFEADTIPGNSREMARITHETHGVLAAVDWAKTGRGGRQFDMFRIYEEGPACSSIYGLCE